MSKYYSWHKHAVTILIGEKQVTEGEKMDKKYICSLIEGEKEKIKNRILILEKKEINESLSNLEGNELACLKDYYDFKIFDDVLQLIHDDYFSTLNDLKHYLRVEIDQCDIPEDRSGADNDDIQVYTIEESNYYRIINLQCLKFHRAAFHLPDSEQ